MSVRSLLFQLASKDLAISWFSGTECVNHSFRKATGPILYCISKKPDHSLLPTRGTWLSSWSTCLRYPFWSTDKKMVLVFLLLEPGIDSYAAIRDSQYTCEKRTYRPLHANIDIVEDKCKDMGCKSNYILLSYLVNNIGDQSCILQKHNSKVIHLQLRCWTGVEPIKSYSVLVDISKTLLFCWQYLGKGSGTDGRK